MPTYPPPYLRTTRCTIGISLPFTLYTTISPTCVSSPRFHRNSKSPLWNAGSMDPDSTTTIGDCESDITERPFHIMNAVDSTSAKLSTWAASCRGCIALRPSIVADGDEGCDEVRRRRWDVVASRSRVLAKPEANSDLRISP